MQIDHDPMGFFTKEPKPKKRKGPPPGAPDGPEWERDLFRNEDGHIKSTFGNVVKIMRGAYGDQLTYNRMRLTPCWAGEPIRDSRIGALREEIEARWRFPPPREAVTAAVVLVADERPFHPVQDYLRSLSWDGTPRIEHVARSVLGIAEPTQLTQRMLRAWFISAVARALRPGCKVDTSIVLVGDQGRKKSSFFETLAGKHFSDSYVDVRSKDGILQVHAAWIYEWAEIDRVTTKVGSSDVKAFLTSATDHVRPPFGVAVIEQARSSVIVGTTNKAFLDDETGARRFWPIPVEQEIDVTFLASVRDQLWAEAVEAFGQGERWWLSQTDEVERETAARDHAVDNPWLEKVSTYVSNPSRAISGVTIADVLVGALGFELKQVSRGEETRVGKTLHQLGWTPRRESRGNMRIRVYRPPPPGQPVQPGQREVCTRLSSPPIEEKAAGGAVDNVDNLSSTRAMDSVEGASSSCVCSNYVVQVGQVGQVDRIVDQKGGQPGGQPHDQVGHPFEPSFSDWLEGQP